VWISWIVINIFFCWCRRGRDRMVVGFKTTYAISAYHHWSCEFESHSREVYLIQHYVIKFDSDLRQAGGFLRALWFPPPIKLTATIQMNPSRGHHGLYLMIWNTCLWPDKLWNWLLHVPYKTTLHDKVFP
jgi:hypothetical protein